MLALVNHFVDAAKSAASKVCHPIEIALDILVELAKRSCPIASALEGVEVCFRPGERDLIHLAVEATIDRVP